MFGYREGHELLAGSLPVTGRLQRELLAHTDARFDDGAAHYLVGVKVPDLGRYLLVRIWPAPEVPRPGAVWAHALLLERQHLAIDRCGDWLGLFRRPSIDALGDYSSPIFSRPPPRPSRGPEELLSALSWVALGATARHPIVLWSPVQDAEPALLALQSSLPLAARWHLSFRTRGRARGGAGRYDLQVASAFAGKTNDVEEFLVLDPRRQGPRRPPRWTQLTDQDNEPLRRFLGRFGDDDAVSRAEVAGLARVWASLQEQREPEATAALLFRTFPSPDMVEALRTELLGRETDHGELWSVSEAVRLQLILDHEAAIDVDQLELLPRLRTLWLGRRSQALELTIRELRDARASDLGQAIARIAAAELAPEELSAFRPNSEAFNAILDARPRLLEFAASWLALPPGSDLKVLQRRGRSLNKAALARALVESSRTRLVDTAIQEGILGVDDVAQACLFQPDASQLLRLLADNHADGVKRWLEQATFQAKEERIVVASLPIDLLDARDPSDWRIPAELHATRSTEGAALSAKLLAVALGRSDTSGDPLLRECFAPVHRALAEQRLEEESWVLLDRVLPGASDWDRARRLRRALLLHAERGWSEADLIRTLEGAGEHGARLVELLGEKHPLRRVVEQAIETLGGLGNWFR